MLLNDLRLLHILNFLNPLHPLERILEPQLVPLLMHLARRPNFILHLFNLLLNALRLLSDKFKFLILFRSLQLLRVLNHLTHIAVQRHQIYQCLLPQLLHILILLLLLPSHLYYYLHLLLQLLLLQILLLPLTHSFCPLHKRLSHTSHVVTMRQLPLLRLIQLILYCLVSIYKVIWLTHRSIALLSIWWPSCYKLLPKVLRFLIQLLFYLLLSLIRFFNMGLVPFDCCTIKLPVLFLYPSFMVL